MQSDEWLPRTHGVSARYANTRSQKEPRVPAGGTGNGHVALFIVGWEEGSPRTNATKNDAPPAMVTQVTLRYIRSSP